MGHLGEHSYPLLSDACGPHVTFTCVCHSHSHLTCYSEKKEEKQTKHRQFVFHVFTSHTHSGETAATVASRTSSPALTITWAPHNHHQTSPQLLARFLQAFLAEKSRCMSQSTCTASTRFTHLSMTPFHLYHFSHHPCFACIHDCLGLQPRGSSTHFGVNGPVVTGPKTTPQGLGPPSAGIQGQTSHILPTLRSSSHSPSVQS